MSERGALPAKVVILSTDDARKPKDSLVTHLDPLVHKGLLELWHRDLVAAGDPSDRITEENVALAAVTVVLLTADLLSDSLLSRLIATARERGVVVPVLLRSCLWEESSLSDLTPLPASREPIEPAGDRDAAWNEVAKAIEAALGVAKSSGAIDRAAPPPGNLPARVLFVGRLGELAALRKCLGVPEVGVAKRASLLGLAGVGKTRLAIEYASAHASSYPGGVYWVRAAGEPVAALAAFANELRAIAPPAVAEVLQRAAGGDASAIAVSVRLALQANPQPSLVVFDGVDADWAARVPGGSVHALATTRDPNRAIGDPSARMQVRPLTKADAIDLAEAIAPGCAGDEIAARERVVLRDLGALPFLVERAARAVARGAMTWAGCEAEIREGRNPISHLNTFGAYKLLAYVALDLSIDLCTEDSACGLLGSLGALAPERVPMEWAEAGAVFKTELLIDIATSLARRASALIPALGQLESGKQYEHDPAIWERAWGVLSKTGLVEVDLAAREASVPRPVHRRLRDSLRMFWRDAAVPRIAPEVIAWLKKTVGPAGIDAVEARRPHVEAIHAALEGSDAQSMATEIADLLARHRQLATQARPANG